MSRYWRNGPAYLQVASMWAQTFYVYRFNVVTFYVSILLQVYLLKMVWTAIYAGRGTVDGIDLDSLIVYLTLANMQMAVMFPQLPGLIEQRVREGLVAVDLARPMSFLNQLVAQQFGTTVAIMPFVLIAFPFAALIGGIQLPPSAGTAVLYLLSLSLAYLIMVLIGLLLGLIAFWTLEIYGFLNVYRFVNQFFAGALVPLWFFPPTLRTVAEFLPFQTQAFIPIGIYLGEIGGDDALRALGVQVFWVGALYLVAHVVWRRAMHRVVVQGG